MRRTLLLLLALLVLASIPFIAKAMADSTDRSIEYILNRVFDSNTNTLRVQ